MIIDATYFQGAIEIAQKTEPANAAALNKFMVDYETQFLNKLLGYELAKNFVAGIADDPVVDKWKDIRDGKEFTCAGVLTKWIGFSNTVKLSPIANYVYTEWQRYKVSESTGLGEKKMTFAGAINYSPSLKISDAWNQMVDWNRTLDSFLRENATTYPEYKTNHRCELFLYINTFGL